MTRSRALLRGAIVLVLLALGGLMAWHAAPYADVTLFPVLKDQRLVPFDPARPDVLAERQLDRVCWRLHVHKVRSVATRRWAITIIEANGTRWFSEPIDGRTGRPFSSKDTYSGGFEGEVPLCTWLPGDFDATQAFDIESWGQYEPSHRLWYINQSSPIIHVPAASGLEGDR